MKTVLDAVIKFKGECSIVTNRRITHCVDSENWFVGLPIGLLSNGEIVCTTDEFNALVDELASNFGKCDISYQEHCSDEVTRLEGNKMKTVIHEGNIYQIGAVYELSDDGKDWEIKVLSEVSDSAWSFFSGYERSRYIRECKASVIGTITEAPVQLVDGECYQFTAPSGAVRKGYFRKRDSTFVTVNGLVDAPRCANIKLLTVA